MTLPVSLAVVFALISWQVAADGPLLELDTATRGGVRSLRKALHSIPLNHLGATLADLGGSVPAIPVLLGCAGLAAWLGRSAGRPRWWLPLVAAPLAAVLIPLLVVPAKAWFARPGPYGLPLAAEQWGWYPSGHTATSAIAYGSAALLLARVVDPAVVRPLYVGTGLLCLGVGAGLVWSDYHWLLDVLASWCLAGLVLWTLAAVLRRLDRPPGHRPDHRPGHHPGRHPDRRLDRR